MNTLLGILVVLHIICWALAFGIWAAALRTREPATGLAHAASGAVLFGLLAMIVSITQYPGGHLFYALKLVFAIIAMVCAWIAVKRGKQTNAVIWYAIPVSILVNIVIGVFRIGG